MPYSAGMERELQAILNRLERHPAPIETAEMVIAAWRTDLVIRAYKDRDSSGETLPAIAARLGISYMRAWGIVRAYKARNRAAAGSPGHAPGKSGQTAKPAPGKSGQTAKHGGE